MRIRKRSAATSSGNRPELQEGSNGGLHLHATSKSNPRHSSPYYSRSSLSPHAGIIKQDHLLLASSSYCALNGSSEKQPPAEAVLVNKRKPCSSVLAGVECYIVMMQKGEENPSVNSDMDAQQINEMKHIHMHEGDDKVKGMYQKGCKEVGLLGITREEGNKLSEVSNKEKHSMARRGRRSALLQEVNAHADPATVDASDCARKVRPLQLILNSDYSPTAPKLPLPLCPTTRSSNTMPCAPLPLKLDKTSPSALVESSPLNSSAAAGGASIKQIAEAKSRDDLRLLRNDDASSCSSEQSLANVVGNRAELESCRLLQPPSVVSSWKGHRRPRSHVQGGRGRPGFNCSAVPSVNAVFTKHSTLKSDPTEQITRRKPKQTKRKPIDTLVSMIATHPASPSAAPANYAELEKQECLTAKNNAHTKMTPNEPLFQSTSLAYDVLPNSAKMQRSLLAAESPDTEHAATTTTLAYDTQVASVPPAAASDHELQHDSMQCRRKDGRRWRCKAQVVKAGAPFCYYHTLKMREKHAASVARRPSKQLQGKVSHADYIRSSNKRANKRIMLSSSLSIIAADDGYGGGCKVGAVDNEAEKNEPENKDEDEDEEEKNKTEDEQQKKHGDQLVAGKQQMQESVTLKRRWRKKCKPCIRRLHDIHDRARPAGMDSLDLFNPYSNINKDSPPLVRSGSPLPECLLNTDPYEWRSDFP